MSKLAKTLSAAAGNAGGDKLFVEDVFSTYLYKGNGSSPTITTGIDMLGEGGLVWNKNRTQAIANLLVDSERGVGKYLSSDSAASQANITGNSFTNTGYVLGTDMGSINNNNYASWSWRKAKGWFDIQTYTGNYTAGTTIAHNLGSVPKMMFIKNTSGTGGGNREWIVYHASLGGTKFLNLNLTASETTRAAEFNNTDPTSSVFTLGGGFNTNQTGESYVAYLFGDDAIFGENGDEQICKMGSFTTDGNATPQDINLGFEPQWFMYKRTDSSSNWFMADIMRGWTAQDSGVAAETYLYANLTAAEASPNAWGSSPTSRGITWRATGLTSNSTYIYMAIRRPMKVPTTGTEVFIANEGTASAGQFVTGFPVDLNINTKTSPATRRYALTRLQGDGRYLRTEDGSAEAAAGSSIMFTNGNASTVFDVDTNWWSGGTNVVSWSFKRAAKFMDVVAYTGDDAASRAVPHNLTAIPEMYIVKSRNATYNWHTYVASLGNNKELRLDSTIAATSFAYWANTTPTATAFYVSDSGNVGIVNNGGTDYITYLFATLDGISKVGSYTGNATNTTIDCGFSNGARFILIKRTDATGDWYVYDSTRGITTGISPYLVLNTVSVEVTNAGWLEAASSGFLVNDNATTQLNINYATYIFLAIA